MAVIVPPGLIVLPAMVVPTAMIPAVIPPLAMAKIVCPVTGYTVRT